MLSSPCSSTLLGAFILLGLVEESIIWAKQLGYLVETMRNIVIARPAQKPRIKKSCTGCGDYFTCFKQANYDYCRNCAINGNRYCQNQCPECGNGSGVIKFKGKPPRECKLCALTKPKINCFYGCDFMASIAHIMEQHYQQRHPFKPKEVKRG